jgi:DNA invertase Pin-like site-specific DNA recombinase
LTENIDTTTPGGRLIFHVFGALGQFERDLIRERTKAGLTAAAARGRKGGRKPVVTADKLQRARELVANGLNVREAAARLKVGKPLSTLPCRRPVLAVQPTPDISCSRLLKTTARHGNQGIAILENSS